MRILKILKEIGITIVGQLIGIFTDNICLGCLRWIKHVKVKGYHGNWYYRVCPYCDCENKYLNHP